jgi:hypothetical protein
MGLYIRCMHQDCSQAHCQPSVAVSTDRLYREMKMGVGPIRSSARGRPTASVFVPEPHWKAERGDCSRSMNLPTHWGLVRARISQTLCQDDALKIELLRGLRPVTSVPQPINKDHPLQPADQVDLPVLDQRGATRDKRLQQLGAGAVSAGCTDQLSPVLDKNRCQPQCSPRGAEKQSQLRDGPQSFLLWLFVVTDG